MDLWKIAVRAIAVYVFLIVSMRLSGTRTVAQATSFDFVLALIFGDMMDDAIWAEVPFSHFIVGTTTLFVAHVVVGTMTNRGDRSGA